MLMVLLQRKDQKSLLENLKIQKSVISLPRNNLSNPNRSQKWVEKGKKLKKLRKNPQLRKTFKPQENLSRCQIWILSQIYVNIAPKFLKSNLSLLPNQKRFQLSLKNQRHLELALNLRLNIKRINQLWLKESEGLQGECKWNKKRKNKKKLETQSHQRVAKRKLKKKLREAKKEREKVNNHLNIKRSHPQKPRNLFLQKGLQTLRRIMKEEDRNQSLQESQQQLYQRRKKRKKVQGKVLWRRVHWVQ